MSATLIPDYISVSEPAVLSFARRTRARKPALKPALQDPEQELRAVQERVLQLRKQYELAPQECAQELLEQQAYALELFSRQRPTLGAADSGSTEPTNQYGFPRPSSQQSPPASATGKHYFVDETQWQTILG